MKFYPSPAAANADHEHLAEWADVDSFGRPSWRIEADWTVSGQHATSDRGARWVITSARYSSSWGEPSEDETPCQLIAFEMDAGNEPTGRVAVIGNLMTGRWDSEFRDAAISVPALWKDGHPDLDDLDVWLSHHQLGPFLAGEPRVWVDLEGRIGADRIDTIPEEDRLDGVRLHFEEQNPAWFFTVGFVPVADELPGDGVWIAREHNGDGRPTGRLVVLTRPVGRHQVDEDLLAGAATVQEAQSRVNAAGLAVGPPWEFGTRLAGGWLAVPA